MVATNGCFDLLHVGHVRYLAAARRLGDVLVVGLNGDESVRALKGEGRPLNSEHDRAEVLAALESVNYVTIFPQVRATAFLEASQPAVYVKGGDYKLETLNPEERGALQRCGADRRNYSVREGLLDNGTARKIASWLRSQFSARVKDRIAEQFLRAFATGNFKRNRSSLFLMSWKHLFSKSRGNSECRTHGCRRGISARGLSQRRNATGRDVA